MDKWALSCCLEHRPLKPSMEVSLMACWEDLVERGAAELCLCDILAKTSHRCFIKTSDKIAEDVCFDASADHAVISLPHGVFLLQRRKNI